MVWFDRMSVPIYVPSQFVSVEYQMNAVNLPPVFDQVAKPCSSHIQMYLLEHSYGPPDSHIIMPFYSIHSEVWA